MVIPGYEQKSLAAMVQHGNLWKSQQGPAVLCAEKSRTLFGLIPTYSLKYLPQLFADIVVQAANIAPVSVSFFQIKPWGRLRGYFAS